MVGPFRGLDVSTVRPGVRFVSLRSLSDRGRGPRGCGRFVSLRSLSGRGRGAGRGTRRSLRSRRVLCSCGISVRACGATQSPGLGRFVSLRSLSDRGRGFGR
ncbi:hypothetical protein GCM10027411_19490 [Microbacterium aureliae]